MTNHLYIHETMVCDTPVPYYHVPVSCGLPNEIGDIPAEDIMLPSALVAGLKCYATDAEGDSMEGVGIHHGDVLLMEQVSRYHNYDIVLAVIDGMQTLKTYYVDDRGRQWLIPANKKYKALLLTEDMNVRFLGRLKCNLRTPRDSRNNVIEFISEYLKEQSPEQKKKAVPTQREVAEALRGLAARIKVARHWLGPCRVLMDASFIQEGRYDLFCELVRQVLPDHKHLPEERELQRMAVGCFSKPFARWTDEKAPVHGMHYLKYYHAGETMLEKLP